MTPAFAWPADEVRRVGHRVVDTIAEYLTSLPDGPVFRPVPPASAERWQSDTLPAEGVSVDVLLDALARDVLPFPFGNGHPRFYGWVNSPPAPIGIFAEAIAAAMNPSVAGGNHAAVYVERQVVRWIATMVGYPPSAMGLLVSGTSTAALTALAVARHAACGRRGWDVRARGLQGLEQRLLLYKGAEGHACHQKAAEVLGLGSAAVRNVPSDDALRIDPGALDAMLEADLSAGHLPVAVVATAGTVNTGAIDPLAAIADVCERRGVWLHVDGAYGGPAVVLEECRDLIAPLARADSVAIDPHKWMYAPVDAGLVLVRGGEAMRDAFSLVPPYLRTDGDVHGVQGLPWFSEYGIEQTRPFRALKVWLTLRAFGRDGFRALFAHDVALARHLAARLRARPDFEVWEPQGLSIVCFRYLPPDADCAGGAVDDLNRAVLSEVQLGGTAFVSSTTLAGRFWLRACIVNPLAAEQDIDALVDAVAAAGRVAAGARPRAPLGERRD